MMQSASMSHSSSMNIDCSGVKTLLVRNDWIETFIRFCGLQRPHINFLHWLWNSFLVSSLVLLAILPIYQICAIITNWCMGYRAAASFDDDSVEMYSTRNDVADILYYIALELQVLSVLPLLRSVSTRIEALRSTKQLLSLVFIDTGAYKTVLLFYVVSWSSYVLGLAIYVYLFVYYDEIHFVTNILFFVIVSIGELVLTGYLSVILLITLLDTEHISLLISDLEAECLNGNLTMAMYAHTCSVVKGKTSEAWWIVDFSVVLCIISSVASLLILFTEENQPIYMLANVAVLAKGVVLVLFVLFRAAHINDKTENLTKAILHSKANTSEAHSSLFTTHEKLLVLSHAVVDPIVFPVTGCRVTTKSLIGSLCAYSVLLAFGVVINIR